MSDEIYAWQADAFIPSDTRQEGRGETVVLGLRWRLEAGFYLSGLAYHPRLWNHSGV